MIDNRHLHEYNMDWLRQHIGVVSQEPVLFQTTIKENIRFGRMEATEEDIENAARMANAHDFIVTLPDVWRKERQIHFQVLFSRNMIPWSVEAVSN